MMMAVLGTKVSIANRPNSIQSVMKYEISSMPIKKAENPLTFLK